MGCLDIWKSVMSDSPNGCSVHYYIRHVVTDIRAKDESLCITIIYAHCTAGTYAAACPGVCGNGERLNGEIGRNVHVCDDIGYSQRIVRARVITCPPGKRIAGVRYCCNSRGILPVQNLLGTVSADTAICRSREIDT